MIWIAELGFNHIADLTRFERKSGLFKGRHHLALAEIPQVAPLLAAGAGGIPFGKCRKISSAGKFLAQLLGLFPGRFLFFRSGLLIDPQQDVAGLYRFGLGELVRVLVIEFPGILFADRSPWEQSFFR